MPNPPRPSSFSIRYLSAMTTPGRTSGAGRGTGGIGGCMRLSGSVGGDEERPRCYSIRPPMKRRGRRPNLFAPEAIEDVLDRAGEDRFAKKKLPIPMRDWRLAVGPRIA